MKTILYFVLYICFLSCQKEDSSDNDRREIENCHNQRNLDLIQLNASLPGKWYWYKSICSKTLLPDTLYKKRLSIEFKSDSTYILQKDSIIVQTGIGYIINTGQRLEIITLPGVGELRGDFKMCEDQLLCNNLGLDICINFFERK